MKLIIDQRELSLINKINELLANFQFKNIDVEVANLHIGDILVKNEDTTFLIIERKTISDLLASIKDGRYAEQSLRLANNNECSMQQIIYLLEGELYQAHKQIIFSSLTSLNIFKGFNIMRTNSLNETAEWLLIMVDKMNRSMNNNKKPFFQSSPETKNYCDVIKTVKKDNVTRENIGNIMLMQIPGISATLATAILDNFENFPDFVRKVNEDSSCLNGLTYTSNGKSRKINKNCIESIKEYLANF